MPICWALMQIWQHVSIDSVLCSRSTYSVSKPAVLAICAISIDRARRTVIDATTSSRASFSFIALRRMVRSSDISWSPVERAQGGDKTDGAQACKVPGQGNDDA